LDDQINVYRVTMLNRAYRDLDGIYKYIANTLASFNQRLCGKTGERFSILAQENRSPVNSGDGSCAY